METLIIISILFGYTAAGQTQTFDRAQVYRYNEEKVRFNFHSYGEDTAQVYMAYKPVDIPGAIQLMKSKGWELINVDKNTPGGNSREYVVTANFKRKRVGYEAAAQARSDNSKTLEYKVVKEVTRVGLPSQNRAITKILFDTVPKEEAMKHTATRLWQQNRQWKEFTVFIYLPGMAADDVAYGMFEFGPKGLQDSFINTPTKP